MFQIPSLCSGMTDFLSTCHPGALRRDLCGVSDAVVLLPAFVRDFGEASRYDRGGGMTLLR